MRNLLLSLLIGMLNPEVGYTEEKFPKLNMEVINPPQSEESKQFYLRKAAEKRARKAKRKL